ncbi:MAG: trypsin-like peptidase domain-containing protein [Bryobacterales bacterium]|nr:trypsin-like peptidase domain-containing protein [Bryobacterales bacterium]
MSSLRMLFILCASSAAAQTNPLRAVSNAIRQMAERVEPAVVQIHSVGFSANEKSTLQLQSNRSTGSGVIVDKDGFLITNAHVVGTARSVEVTLPQRAAERDRFQSVLKPSGKPIAAEVIGIDRETDIAVLKITERNLPFVEFADSEQVRQGDFVFAAGSPLGLDSSLSMGIVSSVARQIRPDDPMIYIQTDAPVNPGNSGGPLLDAEGRIVGINTFILTQSGGSEGLGFAVPSNIVRNVYQQIRTSGRVRRGQVGVVAQTITPALAAALGLKQDWGVLVADVASSSAAESAGLESRDIILTLNGKTMENARQFGVNIYQSAGQTVTVELLRGERKIGKKMAVLERPRDPDRILSLLTRDSNVPRLGVLAVELDEKVTPLLPPLRRLSGVVVAGLASTAIELSETLLPGDVIYECNNTPVRNLAALKTALDAIPAASPIALFIERQGQLQFLLMEPH